MDELDAPVEVLEHGRATVHPVAAIDVAHPFDVLDRGTVDVPADHAIHAAVAGMVRDAGFVPVDEIQRALDLALGIPRKRPVAGLAQLAANPGQQDVDPHEHRVRDVPQFRQPAVVARDLVELVAVDQQVAAAVCGHVHGLADHMDVAERHHRRTARQR